MWSIRYPCFSIGTRPVASCAGFDGLLQLVRAWTAQGRWPLVMSARRNQRWWQVNRHFNGNLVWYTCPLSIYLQSTSKHPLFFPRKWVFSFSYHPISTNSPGKWTYPQGNSFSQAAFKGDMPTFPSGRYSKKPTDRWWNVFVSSRSQGHVTELVTLELASSLCWRLLSWAKMLRAEATKKGSW